MDEHEARALLTAVEAPPSRVEVAGLLRAGRRRVRLRRGAGVAASAALALVVLLAVPAAISAVRAQPGGFPGGSTGGSPGGSPAGRSHRHRP